MNKQILVLSGGVGGAKLALGLYSVLAPHDLTVVVNTGDDFTHLGLRICPDIDTTLYTLADVANTELGWGRADESWNCLQTLTAFGGENWFRLGDKDVALHLLRTQALAAGQNLSTVTQQLADAFGIQATILPMSDQVIATELETDSGRLAFQEYFVKRQCQPHVSAIEYTGAEQALLPSDILTLLQSDQLHAIVIAPSNPLLSIEPILSVPGMRQALQQALAPVIAVSPLIGSAAVKGPTAKIMQELQLSPSALTIAEYYADIIDGFVLDVRDADMQPQLAANQPDLAILCTNTLMQSLDDRKQLAVDVLQFSENIKSNKRLTSSLQRSKAISV